MSNKPLLIDDGGPAFPGQGIPSVFAYIKGMSLRDYFAAKAISTVWSWSWAGSSPLARAKACYEIADAMIAAGKINKPDTPIDSEKVP